ncbi:MAG: 4Fe-4S binding protein [Clostridiales bacterium]|nr:4Fe-4S binding protein [Clostridiales bacterium]
MKSVKLLIRFPADKSTTPLTYHLVKDYDLVFNIFKAQIDAGEKGEMALEISGTEDQLDKGLQFLEDEGIEVSLLSKVIVLDEDRCVDCGLCTSVCPTEALKLGEDDLLNFDNEKCVACQMCVITCPMKAMLIHYTDE